MPASKKWAAIIGGLLVLVGCGASPGNDEGTSGTGSEGSTGTGTVPTGTGDGGESSTGGGTGGLDACDPELPAIAEEEFAERFAAAICEQKAACGCAPEFACETYFVDELAAVREQAQAAGLAYDGVCAARKLVGLVEQHGCEMASQVEIGPTCAFECAVYRGDIPPGNECPVLPMPNGFLMSRFIEDCAAPGTCDYYYELVCTSPLPVVGPGEACRDQNAEEIATCEPGHSCDFAQRECVPSLGPGDPCAEQSCPYPLYCSEAELCTAPGETGASCTQKGECLSQRCGDAGCEDWVWICEVAEIVDLFTRNPEVI
ncbi:MAG TPA: hypothetical protein VGB85_17135 [Nannocystis sp.]|jgi:hypothetical protein